MRGKLCGEIGWLEGRITFGELGGGRRQRNKCEIIQCVAEIPDSISTKLSIPLEPDQVVGE